MANHIDARTIKVKYEGKIDLSNKNNSHTIAYDFIEIDSLGSRCKILEVGCSTGYFGEALKNAGHVVWGIEMTPDAAELAKKVLDFVYVGTIEAFLASEFAHQNKFDYIVFGDVLEHLPYPSEILKQCKSILPPNGGIIASIPNVAHLAVRVMLLEGRWEYSELGIMDNTHLRFFDKKSIINMFNESSYSVQSLGCVRIGVEQTGVRVNQELYESASKLVHDDAKDIFQYVVLTKPAQSPETAIEKTNFYLNARLASFQLPKKIAICVTFYFDCSRLMYLDKISNSFNELAEKVCLTVITNTLLKEDLDQIKSTLTGKGFEFSIFTPIGLGHPYLLTWSHFFIFRQLFEDISFSHFLYLEDDILITRENIIYWLEGREQLRGLNFIPSFLRVETKVGNEQWYSTDCTQQFEINQLPSVCINEDLLFVNLPTPYQGMYLLDRELMSEHLLGISSNPDFGTWGIREKAAQGLTFLSVSKGFISRNLIPYKTKEHQIDNNCLIHHTPNNYANQDPRINNYGTIPVNRLLHCCPITI